MHRIRFRGHTDSRTTTRKSSTSAVTLAATVPSIPTTGASTTISTFVPPVTAMKYARDSATFTEPSEPGKTTMSIFITIRGANRVPV